MSKLAKLIFITMYCLTTDTFASIYKCDDHGKISYQDNKCDRGLETITNVTDHTTTNAQADVSSTAPTPNANAIIPEPINNQPSNNSSSSSATNKSTPSPLAAPPSSQPTNKLNNNNQEQPAPSQEKMQQVQKLLNNMPKPMQ